MIHPPSQAKAAVYDGRDCIGFVLARRKNAFEAFDADEHSLGIYPTQPEAADAVTRGAS